jgi:hypothetical protein
MPRWCLLLLALCVPVAAGDPPDTVLAGWQQARDALIPPYQQAVDAAGKTYAAGVDRARDTCLSALVATARREARKPDRSGAVAAWTEVLRLDPDHADATAFFSAIGTLDQVRESLAGDPAPRAVPAEDPFGNALEPSPGATAAPAADHPAVAADLARWREARAREAAAFSRIETAARTRVLDADARLRTRALGMLVPQAERADRAGDLPAAASAWKAVLAVQRDHPAAVAWFTGIGTLDKALAEIPDGTDLLGPPPDPAAGGPGPAAAAGLRGLDVLVLGRADGPLEMAVVQRLTAGGAKPRLVDHSALTRAEAVKELGDPALVVVFNLSDYTRSHARTVLPALKAPLVLTDLFLLVGTGMAGQPNYNATNRDPVDALEPATGIRHPIQGGLTGPLPLLAQPKAGARPKADVSVKGAVLSAPDFPIGAGVLVAHLAGRPQHKVLVTWDAGTPMPGPWNRELGTPPETGPKTPKSTVRIAWVGFFPPEAVEQLHPQVWRLWDQALLWAVKAR